jgi:hypothetical protein
MHPIMRPRCLAGLVGARPLGALAWLLLMTACGYSANLDWSAAENVPFTIRSGVEVARHASGKTPAALSFVCSAGGSLHLLLRTRLPIPNGFRRNILGRDEVVSMFIGEGTRLQLPLVVDVVAKGRDEVEPVADWLIGIDAPDTVVTSQLSTEQVDTLERWFGSTPPTKVSVLGILETGVFMVGTRAGDAIRDLRKSCVASAD